MKERTATKGATRLTGRQDPIPEAPLEIKESHLKLVEDFFGSRWLNKDRHRSFQSLWSRKDILASIELLTFGSALSTFKPKVNENSYRRAAETIKSKDEGNSAAKVFEILASSYFENKKHTVEIPKDNNPGFDFSIVTQGGVRIRFSVKALTDSKHAREFKDFSNKICCDLKMNLKEHSVLFMVQKDFDRKDKYSVSLTTRALREILNKGANSTAYVTPNEWIIRLDKLTPISGQNFSNTRMSYTALLMAPYQRNEQFRFHSKMQEACDNLAQHCPDVHSKLGNGIIIRVPDSISLLDAKNWISGFWEQKHECICSVIIVRASYTSSDDLAQSWLTYEFAHVENPKAKVKFTELSSPEGLEISVPIGRVSTEETKTLFTIYESQIDMKGAYWHFTGHHTYEKKVDLSQGPMKFEFKRVPNVKSSCVFTGFPDGGLELAPHYPPTDELLIL